MVQVLRLRRRRRLSPPAQSAVRTSNLPGAAGLARARPVGIHRLGPAGARPRYGLPSLASGGSSCCSPARRLAALLGLYPGGTRWALIAGGVCLLLAGHWAARLPRLSSGRGHAAPRSPGQSLHSCRPAGRDGHLGWSCCFLIAGAVHSLSAGRPAALHLQRHQSGGQCTLIAGDCQLTVCLLAGCAVLAASSRRGAVHLNRRRLSTHCQSASRLRGNCDAIRAGGSTPQSQEPSTHHQSASRPRGTCDVIRARGSA